MTSTCMKKTIKDKAIHSPCRYKVGAIALDHKGNKLGTSKNYPRFKRVGGSVHAEMELMKRYGTKIQTIIVGRVSKTGKLGIIHPCKICSKKAKQLDINIIPLHTILDD